MVMHQKHSSRNFGNLEHPLQGIAITRSPSRLSCMYPAIALANWARYASTSIFNTNSLRRRCFCKLRAKCNKSRDTV